MVIFEKNLLSPKNMKKLMIFCVLSVLMLSSCVVVRQGEAAMKRRAGKLVGEPITERMKLFNPFVSMYLKVPVRTTNLEVNLDIPSKEGLNIRCETSILYRVEFEKVPDVLRRVGTEYERDMISPVFRSALADVSARFMAKDMHTGQRSVIEKEVRELMMETLGDRGFVIEEVLMKRIILPQALSVAIEEKLSAEQESQRMQFVIEQERQEADRKRIQAEGIRDAQKTLSEGLTPEVLRFEAIDAFKELSKSPNAKVIITGGDTPLMIDGTR